MPNGCPDAGKSTIRISARNRIAGTGIALMPGAANGTVKVDIGGGTIITASITEEAIVD